MSDNDAWVELGHWDDVAAGLRMFLAYIITTVAFGVLILLITIAVASSGGLSSMRAIGTIAKVGGVIGLLITAFGLMAIARYARIAPQTGARGTAVTALVLGGVGLLISAVGLISLMGSGDLAALASGNIWDILARILGVVQFFFIVGSMRTTAGYIGRLDLHALAGQVMLLAGITVALVIFSQLLMATKAAAVALLFGLGTLAIAIWCLVYLIMLVSRLARAVRQDAHLPATFA